MSHPNLSPDQLDRALLELAKGEPDWVLVDRRVLNLLLGPLTDLLVKIPYAQGRASLEAFDQFQEARDYDPDQDGYVWDDDPLC